MCESCKWKAYLDAIAELKLLPGAAPYLLFLTTAENQIKTFRHVHRAMAAQLVRAEMRIRGETNHVQ